MKFTSIRSRVEEVCARYIVSGETIRRLASHFGVSKSTIHRDLSVRSCNLLDGDTANRVAIRATKNKKECYLYGSSLGNGFDYERDIVLDDTSTYDSGNGVRLSIDSFEECYEEQYSYDDLSSTYDWSIESNLDDDEGLPY